MFKPLDSAILVAGQISAADLAAAKAEGVTMVINNRPDGEQPGQPDGAEIEAAAAEAGLAYVAIPVNHQGISPAQVEAMASALGRAEGKVLAFCRSGTRSTMLWALAEATRGRDTDEIAAAAAEAGYDVSPLLPAMRQMRG